MNHDHLEALLLDLPHISSEVKEGIRQLANDAKRYQWLRNEGCNFVWAEIGAGNCLAGLDAAIDAAIGGNAE